MFPISAADAISPAIQRTRTFLFRPFHLGTYLKLCLVALLTEGLGGNSNFSGPKHYTTHKTTVDALFPGPVNPAWVAGFVAIALVGVVLAFVIFYLITRLRFAYFHCLIYNIKQIGPGWHYYRTQATRFFWLNLVVGICFLILLVLVALPFAAGFWAMYRNAMEGAQPSIGQVFALLLPLIPIIGIIVVVAIAVNVILRDLMLPHYALENATAGQAWSAVWSRIRAEKGQFIFYTLLRVILPIIAMIALFVVLILPAIICVVIVVAIEAMIHGAFADATGAAAILGTFLEVLVGVIAFIVAALVSIALGGPISTAIRQYAILFYGGRYQTLGNILFPPPPVAPAAPHPA